MLILACTLLQCDFQNYLARFLQNYLAVLERECIYIRRIMALFRVRGLGSNDRLLPRWTETAIQLDECRDVEWCAMVRSSVRRRPLKIATDA